MMLQQLLLLLSRFALKKTHNNFFILKSYSTLHYNGNMTKKSNEITVVSPVNKRNGDNSICNSPFWRN